MLSYNPIFILETNLEVGIHMKRAMLQTEKNKSQSTLDTHQQKQTHILQSYTLLTLNTDIEIHP